MKGMPLRQFRRVVARVMKTLPEEFRPYLHNVTVDVEDKPDRQTLLDMGFTHEEIAAGESLYGAFMPLSLPALWSHDTIDVEDMPHRIVIYKEPLEQDFSDRRQLMIEIRKTVIHELAHHFGYNERDLERFDATPDPFGEEEQQ